MRGGVGLGGAVETGGRGYPATHGESDSAASRTDSFRDQVGEEAVRRVRACFTEEFCASSAWHALPAEMRALSWTRQVAEEREAVVTEWACGPL